ncbi:MAG: hypothetical protein BWK73_04850 [Thiothrix lacustris]|uniref:Uncharacterized protein n=1 Tax=Thiothrix lacustris TaxID=525917 RepID=A0A1Y1QXM3_9GAMM|nr:MAG: hypothetical protein BWK73_04850 [Thiothrix lacustris]
MELSASFPLLERYYVCKRPADEYGHCGWSGKTREEYVTTLSPSGYGHIDSSGRIIKYLPDSLPDILQPKQTKPQQR